MIGLHDWWVDQFKIDFKSILERPSATHSEDRTILVLLTKVQSARPQAFVHPHDDVLHTHCEFQRAEIHCPHAPQARTDLRWRPEIKAPSNSQQTECAWFIQKPHRQKYIPHMLHTHEI